MNFMICHGLTISNLSDIVNLVIYQRNVLNLNYHNSILVAIYLLVGDDKE
jgi:hypothetical protein